MSNNSTAFSQADRRTSADAVFDQLHSDIVSVRLLPGTKLSESDIAKRYEISRQPVREAFIRLNDLGLLTVRPQKATIVRRISKSAIQQARFVRAAVEVEVARQACHVKTADSLDELEELLQQQADCLENKDIPGFNALDHQFHEGICILAGCDFAIEVINDCKAKVDRLCLLSLANQSDAKQVYSDHVAILKHLSNRDENQLIGAIRMHLSRLDDTIDVVQSQHSDYFEA